MIPRDGERFLVSPRPDVLESPVTPPADPPPAAPPRTDFGIAIFLFCVAFAVYAATCCRTVYTGDSGDFLTATYTGGIPHPSGYPLFLLCARAWATLIPAGEWAFRVNLFVAACGAGAVAFMYRFLALLFGGLPAGRPAAVFGALTLAFAPTIWEQALISEVYSLNLLFLAALFYYALVFARAGETNNAAPLARLCFLFGLALTNHLTTAFAFPFFLAFVLFHKPSLLGKNAFLLLPLAGLFLLPLSLYAYLPLAARFGHAPIRWGMPDTGEALLFHVRGARYAALIAGGPEFFRFGLREWATRYLPAEFGYLLILVPAGVFTLFYRAADRSVAVLLAAVFTAQVLYAANYATPDIASYHMPGFFVLAALIAAGARLLAERLAVRLPSLGRVAAVTLWVLPLLSFAAHYAGADKSTDRRERDYALNQLRSLPPNGVLITNEDTVFSLWYEQIVRRERPDCAVVQRSLFTGSDLAYWYGDALRRAYPFLAATVPPRGTVGTDAALLRFIQAQFAASRPVCFVPDPRAFPAEPGGRRMALRRLRAGGARPALTSAVAGVPTVSFGQSLARNYHEYPWGLVVRLYPAAAPQPPPAALLAANHALWESFALGGVFGYPWASEDDPLHQWMAARYADGRTDCGRVAEAAGDPVYALVCYREGASIYPLPEAVSGIRRLGGVENPAETPANKTTAPSH